MLTDELLENSRGPFSSPTIAPRLQASGGANWYALQTCPRHEKRLHEQLLTRGIEVFLPLYTELRRWKDRRTAVQFPLFPGYMFVRLLLSERLRVLELPSAVRLIGAAGRPTPLDATEILALRRGLESGGRAEPYPFLRVGQRVRIIGGPFAGSTGILLRKKEDFRVVLSVEIILRSVAVEVSGADVEPMAASA